MRLIVTGGICLLALIPGAAQERAGLPLSPASQRTEMAATALPDAPTPSAAPDGQQSSPPSKTSSATSDTLGPGEGQQTKMELVYQYLTGPRFRHRIEAVKTTMRLWAKREAQIRGVVESTAGLYGDLQGIAGRSLLEIDGLELPLLDGPAAADAAE